MLFPTAPFHAFTAHFLHGSAATCQPRNLPIWDRSAEKAEHLLKKLGQNLYLHFLPTYNMYVHTRYGSPYIVFILTSVKFIQHARRYIYIRIYLIRVQTQLL